MYIINGVFFTNIISADFFFSVNVSPFILDRQDAKLAMLAGNFIA